MASSDQLHQNDGSSELKLKKMRVNGVGETLDRLSELPDSLLLQILSLLVTKEAIRTCVLSKRWRYLWTFADSFIFINCTNCSRSQNFVSFVDYVLAHSVSSKIKKFEINCHDLDEYEPELNQWVTFAIEKKVENVVIRSVSDRLAVAVPYSLCIFSSLITLAIRSCYFENSGLYITWKSLKSITLEDMEIYDDDIAKLLSGCPTLETMELYEVWGFRRLEIKSSKLKGLKLRCYNYGGSSFFLDIFAPYLQHLEISGDLYYVKCRLVDVSSVISATITFNIRCIKKSYFLYGEDEDIDEEEDNCRDYRQHFRTLVQDFLKKLSNATELIIGTWFTEVLCMLQLEGVQIPELKCKYLTLELQMKRSNLHGVAGILRASPHVETLNIDVTTKFDDSRCDFELRHFANGDDIDLDCWISSFEFPNIKNVKIVISNELCLKDHSKWGFDKLFKLTEFLLMNSKSLEKVVIRSTEKCKSCSANCVSQYLFRFSEKFLGCLRSSTNPVIIIFQE